MKVCDITRKDVVVATARIQMSKVPGTPTADVCLDLGQRALDALLAGDYYTLGQLVPKAHRPAVRGPYKPRKPVVVPEQPLSFPDRPTESWDIFVHTDDSLAPASGD